MDITIDIDPRLSLNFQKGEHFDGGGLLKYNIDIYYDEKHVANIDTPEEPWSDFTTLMLSKIITKRIDEYGSSESVDDALQSSISDHKEQFAEYSS